MLKGESWTSFDGKTFRVEGNDVDSIVVVFNEASDGDALAVVVSTRWRGRESHGVKRVRGFISDGIFGSEMGFLS